MELLNNDENNYLTKIITSVIKTYALTDLPGKSEVAEFLFHAVYKRC